MSEERPFGGSGKAPYVPQYGTADFLLILREAGLNIGKYGTEDFLAEKGMGTLYELFSDGELIVVDPRNPFLAAAEPEVRHGEFYARLASLRKRAQNEPGSA